MYWYSMLTVQICWNGNLSKCIKISKVTRQGRLSSPFIYILSGHDNRGIRHVQRCKDRVTYIHKNIFCYTDGVLLLRLTASGIHKLTDNADTRHCLSFDATKSVCAVYGKRKYHNTKWYIKGEPIKRENEVKYLGVMLSNNSNSHTSLRLKAGRGAFYKLQGVGLCANGLKPQVSQQCSVMLSSPFLALLD